MKHARVLTIIVIGFILAGLLVVNAAWGQDPDPPAESFVLVQELGRIRPQGIQYDSNFDQFVMVDPTGQLILVDGATFETRYVLYERGSYSVYTFSHNGRWLALGIDRRVELWDTRTGALVIDVEPEEALSIQAPLQFSYDDDLLLINAVVPAPAALRRSENDTSNLPYLWDLPAARNEADTTLPRFFELYSFYDYRYGFVMGPNRKVITGLPQRLQVMDVADKDLPILSEIASSRHERDPISIWHSMNDDHMYVLPQGENNVVQIDTATGISYELPLGRNLTYSRLAELEGNVLLSDQARIIGKPVSRETNSLLRMLFGDNYRTRWDYHPLTVMLVDVLKPITMGDDQTGFLLYIFDDEAGYGVLAAVRPPDVDRIALHPDNIHVMVRRTSGLQPVEVYNLTTGAIELTIHPAIPLHEHSILSYDGTGDVIVCDFQRFDARTGAVLYEDLHYIAGLNSYIFTANSQEMVTINGSEWWEWDIQTGAVVRREIIDYRGSVLDMDADSRRVLTVIDTDADFVIEISNIGTEQRRSVAIERLPGRDIQSVIPSPDWENYLIVYTPYTYSQHYPGNEIALYNMAAGKLWFVAGDDLPPPERSEYGWLNNDTVYVGGYISSAHTQPERIYGLDYHASGLPTCLVEAFPDQWTQWVDLWEQLNARMRADSLGRLTERLCAIEDPTAEKIDAVFSPSPTPTRLSVTATPAFVAGVPACLTARFPDQALDYAAAWRNMIAGKTAEEIADLEELLCQGLGEASGLSSASFSSGGPPGSDSEIMTIDARTGLRSVGSYLPTQPRAARRNLQLVLDEFERTSEVYVNVESGVFSPDGTLLAIRDRHGFIDIYRLVKPYETLVADATATAAPQQEATPKYISVQPTATQPFDYAGMPRPTLTPTVTPTPPPRTDTVINQPRYGEVENLCPSDTLYLVSDPPPNYAASGKLLVDVVGSQYKWELDAATGTLRLNDTLPVCQNCTYSFDLNWILREENGNTLVSRPDGSDARVLFHAGSYPLEFDGIYWIDRATLEYRYAEYQLDIDRYPIQVIARIDPAMGETSEAFVAPPPIRVNDLYTDMITSQPDGSPFALVRSSFTGARSTGYKYYIYDRDTNTAEYFARLVDESRNEIVETIWHPLGKALYYRYPDTKEWYVYDVATRQHYILGDLPGGTWSRDGRYRVDWFTLPNEEREARKEAELPPIRLRVWDSETGLIRQYCIPETEQVSISVPFYWSPDNRYLVFQTALDFESDETARPHTLVLDTQTGTITELTFDVTRIEVWTGGNHATP